MELLITKGKIKNLLLNERIKMDSKLNKKEMDSNMLKELAFLENGHSLFKQSNQKLE